MSKFAISLLDISNDTTGGIELTPKSKKACRRLGIEPFELIFHPLTEFMGKGMDKQTAESRFNFLEQKRIEKLKWLKEEYNKITEKELKSQQETHQSLNLTPGDMVDLERRQLEKFEKRQQQELQQLIEYQLRMEAMREKNEERAKKAEEREEQRRREIMEKQRQQEEKRIRDELRKNMIKLKEEEDHKKRAQEDYERAQKKIQEEQRREQDRKESLKRKELERKLRQEAFRMRAEEVFQAQARWIEEKKEIFELKDANRKEVLAQQSKENEEETIRLQYEKESKIKAARENLGVILEYNRDGYEKRQEASEIKRKKIEAAREQAKAESAKRAELKAQEIKRVIELNQINEQKRREDLIRSANEAEKRFQEQQKRKENEIRKRKEEEEIRNELAEMTRKRQEEYEKMRIQRILEKRIKEEAVIKKRIVEKEEMLRNKKELDEVKRADKKESLLRITKQVEYRKEEMLERIQDEYSRIERLKDLKNSVAIERKMKKNAAEAEKHKILEIFHQMKKKKGNLKQYNSIFSSNLTHQISVKDNKSSEISRDRSRERSKVNKTITNTEDLTINEEIMAKLKELKAKNLKEMQDLLDQEESEEVDREKKLSEIVDDDERKKADREFGIQRAKASERIKLLASKHIRSEKNLADKLGSQ